jgi:hypothetical protein
MIDDIIAYLYWSMPPVTLPMIMVLKNVTFVILTLCVEGRLKPNMLVYACRYAATIPSARHGDMQPFLLVLAGPVL